MSRARPKRRRVRVGNSEDSSALRRAKRRGERDVKASVCVSWGSNSRIEQEAKSRFKQGQIPRRTEEQVYRSAVSGDAADGARRSSQSFFLSPRWQHSEEEGNKSLVDQYLRESSSPPKLWWTPAVLMSWLLTANTVPAAQSSSGTDHRLSLSCTNQKEKPELVARTHTGGS